jgi:hypothetical protein
VTAHFGCVTAEFGSVTTHFGDVTDACFLGQPAQFEREADLSRGSVLMLRVNHF